MTSRQKDMQGATSRSDTTAGARPVQGQSASGKTGAAAA